MIDFETLAARLASDAPALLAAWLPNGKRVGREWVVGNLQGEPGDSLSINLDTGMWADFAVGNGGRDLIALYAAIHGLSQGEAARKLDNGNEVGSLPPRPEKPKRDVVVPVPPSLGPCACQHSTFGAPTKVWDYRDATGALMGYVARYNPPDGSKQFVPWTAATDAKGSVRWGAGQWMVPRPLYGLQALAQRPGAPVLVVEGEKAADAASELVPDFVVVTWPGGANAWNRADWGPVRGRTVTLWPDADPPGTRAMAGIATELGGGTTVLVPPADAPAGWDAADAADELATWAEVLARMTPSRPGNGQAGAHVEDFDSRPEPPPLMPEPTTTQLAPSGGGSVQMYQLDQNGTGQFLDNLNNAVKVLESDSALVGLVWFDEFLQRILTSASKSVAAEPTDSVHFTIGTSPREWVDVDDINLALYMQREIGLRKIRIETVHEAVQRVAHENHRHSVRDWIAATTWDGIPRVGMFFPDHFGCEDTDYTRAVSRNFWVSIAARIYAPGCKVDTMIILEGDQGRRKSTALQAIGGAWFTEQHEAVTGKGFFEVLQGKLIIEIGEMNAFGRAETTRVKQVVSNPSDRFRQPYARTAKDHPRQCVFVGTTNKDDWNHDDTGARRFWPIRCDSVDVDAIIDSRAQLFAEAAELYRSGAKWWEVPETATKVEQDLRYDPDPWHQTIADYVSTRSLVTTSDILLNCIQKPTREWQPQHKNSVSRTMRVLGWRELVAGEGDAARKAWKKKSG